MLALLLFSLAALEPLLDNLFVYRDAANVYVIRSGDCAVLIDLASGDVLDKLGSIGVRHVDAIYLTHRDRDQWFGFQKARARGIPIHAPGEPVADYWRKFFPAPHGAIVYSVVVPDESYGSFDVTPGAKIQTAAGALSVVATPGHTRDHVVYTANIGGKKVLFSGDAIYARGKVWQGYQLDWDHWRGHGYEAAAASLIKLRDLNAAVLAPSHGEPQTRGIEETLAITAGRLWRAAELKNFDLYALTRTPPLAPSTPLKRLETVRVGKQLLERLSPHLWLTGNNYFLVDDSGACFAVDNNLDPAEWPPILERIGARKVEKIWITHLHVDHVLRLPELKARYGAEMVTVKPLADLLEHPTAYWHPFSYFDGVKPDRVLADGEEFTWRGYRMRAYHAPGQTWFHEFLETTVDGHRAVFSGDTFQGLELWDLANGTGGWSGFNRGFPAYHAASARLMRKIAPEWVLAAHERPFEFRAEEWDLRVRWAEDAARALDELSPTGRHQFDFNPHLVSVYPLVSQWSAEGQKLELRVANPLDAPLEVRWSGPASGTMRVAAGTTAASPLTIRIPQPAPGSRAAVTIDITLQDRYLGPAVFFLIDNK
jgi:glyoxylase-like metal-dependent hydrolase (beta-lactamase superfamily II)